MKEASKMPSHSIFEEIKVVSDLIAAWQDRISDLRAEIEKRKK